MKKGASGYFTVEAVFVVTICIWVIVGLCFGGLYIHDRAVLSSVTNEMAAEWIADDDGPKKKDWVTAAAAQLDRSLLFLRVKNVEAQKLLTVWNIRVRFELPTALPAYLKKIWTEKVYETAREDVNPALYKWDVDLIEE